MTAHTPRVANDAQSDMSFEVQFSPPGLLEALEKGSLRGIEGNFLAYLSDPTCKFLAVARSGDYVGILVIEVPPCDTNAYVPIVAVDRTMRRQGAGR